MSKSVSEQTLTRVFVALGKDAKRPSEIAKKTRLRTETVVTALKRLEARDVVEHVARGLWRLHEEYRY